jgi:endoglucanase
MKRRDLLRYLAATSAATLGRGFSSAQSSQLPLLNTAPALQGVSVHFNQLGFQPSRSKIATIVNSTETAFRIRNDATGKIVFKGTLTAPISDEASGDTVRQAEFTALKKPGTYRIEIGSALSDPFPIREDVYANALYLTMRSYYGQRCGCAVDLGSGYRHVACHADGAYHASSGKTGKVGNHGGWHDAGDYGRYVVNSGITCGTLLWAWEMYPHTLHTLKLDIPESGKGTPDFLAEIRWNLEWMLAMQDDDGGVFHKQSSEQFCAFIMPEDDHLTSYIIGTGSAPYKNTCATADLSAVMAIAARCYRAFDANFSERCLKASRAAWTWAKANPDVEFRNPPGVSTGGYGDKHCGDEIAWASAELWRTTGEPQYEQTFLNALPDAVPDALPKDLKIAAPGWGDVMPMACWTYLMSERAGSAETKQRIREATLSAADELVQQSRSNGYGNTLMSHHYNWGSNSVAANQSLLLFVASRISGKRKYAECALNNLDYLVGRNCLGVSWVTQLGTRPFMHPHHRPSAADKIDKPWPGLLSGGPNARGGDKVADALPKLPPMRMWADDERAYSLNEIAINWNAPLVFLLAAANSATT